VSQPFHRLLVPYDFSPQSRRALEAAFEIARANGGEITVVNAIPPVTSLAGIRPPGGPVWFPPADVLAAAQRQLQAIADEIGAGRDPAARCRVVVGEPLPVILAAARRADAIVMATTGRGALSHVFLGSIAEKVVRHAPVPVLTIGERAGRRLRRLAGRSRVRGPRTGR
jgi:nucleotide-binding universal stress UspA family protein